MKTDTYQIVTDRILASLDAGVAPWVRPWDATAEHKPSYNAITKRQYHGINTLLLAMAETALGYRSRGWMTYKQAAEAGGHVRKGERATWIVFWSTFEVERAHKDGTTSLEDIPYIKQYPVFSVDQCEGLPSKYLPAVQSTPPITVQRTEIDDWIDRLGATVTHGGTRAFYRRDDDGIRLPHPETFCDHGAYYATSLHEHAHWSGAKSRLARDLSGRFGDAAYGAEELIAELASAYLCESLGIEGKLQHAEYLADWLKILRRDKRAIFTAAAQAQKAADYLTTLATPSAMAA